MVSGSLGQGSTIHRLIVEYYQQLIALLKLRSDESREQLLREYVYIRGVLEGMHVDSEDAPQHLLLPSGKVIPLIEESEVQLQSRRIAESMQPYMEIDPFSIHMEISMSRDLISDNPKKIWCDEGAYYYPVGNNKNGIFNYRLTDSVVDLMYWKRHPEHPNGHIGYKDGLAGLNVHGLEILQLLAERRGRAEKNGRNGQEVVVLGPAVKWWTIYSAKGGQWVIDPYDVAIWQLPTKI